MKPPALSSTPPLLRKSPSLPTLPSAVELKPHVAPALGSTSRLPEIVVKTQGLKPALIKPVAPPVVTPPSPKFPISKPTAPLAQPPTTKSPPIAITKAVPTPVMQSPAVAVTKSPAAPLVKPSPPVPVVRPPPLKQQPQLPAPAGPKQPLPKLLNPPAALPSTDPSMPSRALSKSAPILNGKPAPAAPTTKLPIAPPLAPKAPHVKPAATLATSISAPSLLNLYSSAHIAPRRFRVQEIETPHDGSKVVRICDLTNDSIHYRVLLRDDWKDMELAVGDRLSIIGEFGADGCCTVDMNFRNAVVLHPNLLLSCTEIGERCGRRAFLNQRYKTVRKYDSGPL